MFDAVAPRSFPPQNFEAALPAALQSPQDEGTLELIVRRPAVGRRDVLDAGELDAINGPRRTRCSATKDESPHPDMQINVMNSRVIAMIAGEKTRWGLAGDQLYVDLDISEANLPPARASPSEPPSSRSRRSAHTGCAPSFFSASARTRRAS